MSTTKESFVVKLLHVRLAFPNLFTATAVNGEGEPKFGGSFIFPPDHPARKAIIDKCKEVAKAKWGDKADDILKSIANADKLCIHNGDTKSEYDGYPGNYFLNATNKSRPLVLDRNKTPLTQADGRIYAGCYVHASVELWAQDNKYGKRINASLRGVQFDEDGDAFSGGGVASDDEFDDLGGGAASSGSDLI